jgi:hypothetical protein
MVLLTLFAALVCLILGLVFASGPWLIASLACSVLAAMVLWRERARGKSGSTAVAAPKRAAAQTATPPQKSLVTGSAFAGKASQSAESANGAKGRRPKPGRATAADDPEVWVVDGKPDYHLRDCARIGDADAESIPLSQARADGFTECLGCAPVPGSSAPVWVIDGRPDYHRVDCSRLARGTSEQVRLGQALDDGFSACDQCRPEGAPAEEPDAPGDPAGESAGESAGEPADAAAGPSAADAESVATDQVWVVDGRPRYHLETCMIIQGQDAEPIALAQATEDGFMPCSMCEPFVSRV